MDGNGKLSGPDLFLFVDVRAAFHSGVRIGTLAVRNIEVNPITVGADFEFKIVAGIGGVGLEKNFNDVAVPEMIAAAGRFGIRKNSDDAEARAIMEKESFGSPEETHLRFALRVGVFALPIGEKNDWRRSLPSRSGRKAILFKRLR